MLGKWKGKTHSERNYLTKYYHISHKEPYPEYMKSSYNSIIRQTKVCLKMCERFEYVSPNKEWLNKHIKMLDILWK